jgi:hypothetical protein
MESNEPKRLHFNLPQLYYYLVQAHITVLLWGRATGKTQGPGAMFTMNNALSMPRSLGGIVTTTYDKHLTMVLPALVQGWAAFGYQENVHYFVRKFPPPNFFPDEPYRAPKKSDHYIPWYNGSGLLLFSLDRPSLSVGASIDYLYGDEARLFKKNAINEVILTVRGNAEHFGHLSQHGSILFTTDLPKDSGGNWLFDYVEQMDKEAIDLILALQVKIMQVQQLYNDLNKKQQVKADRQIQRFNDYINDLRKGLVHVSFASTLDNVHALGIDVIKRFKRMLSDIEFQVSVLSKRLKQVEKGFYALLDGERHYYDAGNHSYMDSLELDYLRDNVHKDSRWDSDTNPYEPLDMGCDYNFAISSVVVGQMKLNMLEIQNVLYVEHPQQLKDLVKQFASYYRHHQCKIVNYHYDHTALQGRNATSDIRYCDEVANCLEFEGWQVNRHYFGQAMSHQSRYMMFAKLFSGDDPNLPKLGFNRANTEILFNLMQETGTVQRGNLFQKDKSSEKDKNLKPHEQTHLTEAWDMLVTGMCLDRFRYHSDFVDTFI